MGEKGNRTRAAICQESCRLFAEKGFSAVTMKDICEACGLSRGGLYRHYGSTREIFEEILNDLSKEDNDFILNKIEDGISAKEILETELDKMQKEMADSKRSLSYAIYEYSNNCSSQIMEELNQKSAKRWNMLLEYGMKRGEFAQVDASQMTDIILYVYQGIRMWSRVIPINEKTIDNIIEKIRKDLERKGSDGI